MQTTEEQIDLTLEISMEWRSELLHWNTSKYGITRLSVPGSFVWTPTINIEENMDRHNVAAEDNDTVFITSSGLHSVGYYKRLKLQCSFDMCIFPKDTHECTATFYLKQLNSSRAKMIQWKRSSLGTPKKIKTGTWTITEKGNSTEIPIRISFVSDQVSSGLRYNISVKREPMFYLAAVVSPILLLGVISSLSVILPAITGDRVALLLSCLLSTIVYLDAIFKYLPESSRSFPVIFWFILINLGMTGVQIILASVCLNWANKESREQKPGRKFTVLVFCILRWLICFIPIVYEAVKDTRKRRDRVDVIAEEQDSEIIGEEEPKTHQNISAAEGGTDEVKNSYKHAIKLLDHLAMLLALLTLLVIPAAYYITFEAKVVKICHLEGNLK